MLVENGEEIRAILILCVVTGRQALNASVRHRIDINNRFDGGLVEARTFNSMDMCTAHATVDIFSRLDL